MELMDLSNVHFIQAIKGGSVVKVLNINSLGRPTIKVKSINAVYKSIDARSIGSESFLQQQEAVSTDLLLRCDRIERAFVPMDGVTVKCEPETFELNEDAVFCNRRAREDVIFSDMTLKELRSRCRAKRRKIPKSNDLSNRDIKPCTSHDGISSKRACSVRPQEDVCDLDEPLSSLKIKLSQKSKAKRKCTRNHVLSTPESAVLPEAFAEQISSPGQDFLPTKDVDLPIICKIENLEPDDNVIGVAEYISSPGPGSLEPIRNVIPITVEVDDSEPDDNVIGVAEHISSPGQESLEPTGDVIPIGVKTDNLEPCDNVIGVVEHISCPGPDSSEHIRDVIPISFKIDNLESDDSVIYVADGSTIPSYRGTYFGRELSHRLSKRVDEGDLQTGESTSLIEDSQSCVINEVSSEYLELDKPLSLIAIENEMVEEITKMDISATEESQSCIVNEVSCEYFELEEPLSLTISKNQIAETNTEVDFPPASGYESLPSLVCEHMKEVNISHSLLCNPAEAILVTENPYSETHRSCKDLSCSQEIACLMDSSTVTQMSKMSIDDSLECVEQNSSGDACDSEMLGEGNSKEDTPPNLEDNVVKNSESLYMSSQNSSPCFNRHTVSESVDDGSPRVEKYSSLMNEGTLSSVVGAVDCSSGTPPDATSRLTVMDALVNNHSPHLQYPPKRLFSTRKAISPSSQEKLCHAMDEDELYDHIKRSRLGLEGAKIIISPERVLKKRKTESSQSVRKGILKVPNISCVPRNGIECASIQYCAQNAVAFSQRQMRDIEGLAAKLVKELKTMKDIMEETLLTEVQSSTQLKVTVDKMKMATENAAEVEETTRKWLSMMGKDCNRFCKIMRSTEKKAAAAASSHEVNKERKKITFADEAGGVLCHFKLIERRSAAPSVSETETVDQNL